MTHVSTFIFQGLYKNIVFRSVALVTKKLWAILDFFFHRPNFFPPCILPYLLKKKKNFTKNPLNYFSLKVTNFTVIVSKMRVLGQKNYKWPPPSLFRVKELLKAQPYFQLVLCPHLLFYLWTFTLWVQCITKQNKKIFKI